MRLRWILIFAIFWLILGVISIPNNPTNYMNYGYLIIGFLFLGNYIFKSKNQYLTIDSEMITIHTLVPKKIILTDLKKIKKLARDYILVSENGEIRIETRLIEKNSLKDLKKTLKNLEY